MGKPYGARAIIKSHIIRLEKPYHASGKAVSYVWKSRIIRLEPYPRAFISATRSFPDPKRWEQ